MSKQIEILLQGELADTVAFYIRKYGQTFEEKLGLSEDDLLNDAREQIWKGLLSHNVNGAASIKTFLTFIIANRFKTLARKASLGKYNCVQYYADIFGVAGNDESVMMTEETGEAIYEARQQLAVYLTLLTEVDREIYTYLLQGYSLAEMVQAHNAAHAEAPITRVGITIAINRVQETVTRNRRLDG